MVSNRSIGGFRGGHELEDLFWWVRVRGTVLEAVAWKVGLILVYTLILLLSHTFILRLDYPATLISILGMVVGLLLGFRTNSAYDRYWEGRKWWSELRLEIRKLTQYIWYGVDEPNHKTLIEKKSGINLLIAFAVATKHYLRQEYSDEYEDLSTLIHHLPRFTTPPSVADDKEALEKQLTRTLKCKLSTQTQAPPTNIPLEISNYLITYFKHVKSKELVEDWALSRMYNSHEKLVVILTNFERILRTPIPIAYSVHLHVTVYIYILSLPFQIIGTVGWMALVVMALASFCLLGLLAVAYEIENPFGFDENDLPLDNYCEDVRAEVDMVLGTRVPKAEDWIYSEHNRPFYPFSKVSVKGLGFKKAEDLYAILAKARATHTYEPPTREATPKI